MTSFSYSSYPLRYLFYCFFLLLWLTYSGSLTTKNSLWSKNLWMCSVRHNQNFCSHCFSLSTEICNRFFLIVSVPYFVFACFVTFSELCFFLCSSFFSSSFVPSVLSYSEDYCMFLTSFLLVFLRSPFYYVSSYFHPSHILSFLQFFLALKITPLWDMTPFILVRRYQGLEGTCKGY